MTRSCTTSPQYINVRRC